MKDPLHSLVRILKFMKAPLHSLVPISTRTTITLSGMHKYNVLHSLVGIPTYLCTKNTINLQLYLFVTRLGLNVALTYIKLGHIATEKLSKKCIIRKGSKRRGKCMYELFCTINIIVSITFEKNILFGVL